MANPWEIAAQSQSPQPSGGKLPWEIAAGNSRGVVDNATSQNMRPFKLPDAKSHNIESQPPPFDPIVTDVPWSDREKDMAKNGIDIVSGVPYGLKTNLDMIPGATDEDRKYVINKYFGQDVGVRRNQYGELQFNNPRTGLPTTVFSHQYNAPTVGSAFDLIGQATGAIAGGGAAMETGSPFAVGAASTAGSALGQSVVDIGKLVASKALGTYNPSRTASDNIKAVAGDAKDAAENTAIGETVGGVPRIGRWFLNSSRKIGLKYSDALDLQDAAQSANQDLGDYYKLVGTQHQLMLSIPELTQDPKARMAFNKAWRTGDDIAAEEEGRVNSNLSQLAYNFKNIADMYKPSDPSYTQGSSGQNIKDVFVQKKQAGLLDAQLRAQVEQDNAKRVALGLPQMSPEQMNQRLTDMLNTAEQAGKSNVDKAYADLKVALGVPASVAGLKTSDRYFQEQVPTVMLGLSPVSKMKLQNYYNEAIRDLHGIDPDIGRQKLAAIPEGLLTKLDEYGNAGTVPGLNLDRQDDLYHVVESIQNMRYGIRQAMKTNKGNIQPRDQDVATMEDILSENVESYFKRNGNPAVMDKWEAAQQATRDYAAQFRQGVLREVMQKQDGFTPTVYNQAVSKLLMNSGKEAASQSGPRELAGILKGDPEAYNDVRNMIWGIYQNHYLPSDGIPTRASFNQFKDDLAGPIKYFFSDADRAKMDSFDSLTGLIKDSTNAVKKFNQQWTSSTYGKLGKPSSYGLSNAVFSQSISPQNLKGLGNFLRDNNPDLLEQLRSDTALKFAQQTSDNGVPNPQKIAAYVAKYGDRLNDIMGPQYLNNVQVLSGAMQRIVGPQVKLEPDAAQSIFEQVIRAKFAPPLSEEGRWYSALLEARRRAAGRVVYNALSSPIGLSKFIRDRDVDNKTQIGMGILGELGGKTLTMSNPQQ